MKHCALILSIVMTIFSFGCRQAELNDSQLINPVIGDISFVNRFGHKPVVSTNNELRIQTHLAYAESLLRQKNVSHLSPVLKQKREHVLNLLHQYIVRGKFPKNYDHANKRKPCFIDRDGTICAVGYLIEQTAGRQAAERINDKYKYDNLLAMNDPMVDDWVSESGLTKNECAIIQPTYGPTPTYSYNNIKTSYAISSSVFGGVNLSLSTINSIQLANGKSNKLVPVVGLITGAGQIFVGASNFPKDQSGFNGVAITNGSQRTLSMINVGLGTTSVILSAWNLINSRKPKIRNTTLNLQHFQTPQNNSGLALHLVRKF